MSAVLSDKHNLHIYQRSRSNKEIYRCTHPDCHHYTRREFLIGKRAECPLCKNDFIITQAQLRVGQKRAGNKDLYCEFHSKSPKAIDLATANDIVSDVLSEYEKSKNQQDGGGI